MRHTFRYTVAGEPRPGALVELGAEDARHLTRVVRRSAGDPLEVIDQGGRIWPAILEDPGPPAYVRLADRPRTGPPALPLDLFVGLAEWGRLDLVVEKCTEIGVRRITIFTSERARRGDAAAFERRRARMGRLAEAAARQSGQGRRPELAGLVPFSAVIGEIGNAPAFLLDPGAERTLGDELRRAALSEAHLIVGPEAGLGEAEVAAALAAGATGCRLGGATLRVETAAIAACAVAADHLASAGG